MPPSAARERSCGSGYQTRVRLIGAVLLRPNNERLQHRYMQTEAVAELLPPTIKAVPNESPP